MGRRQSSSGAVGRIITVFQTKVATGHWNRLVMNTKRGLIPCRIAGTVLLSPYYQRCLLAPFKHRLCPVCMLGSMPFTTVFIEYLLYARLPA